MNNLSYIIVWFLFAGMIYVGFEIKNNIAQQEINRVQSIEDERIAKEKAIQDAIDQEIADKDKFIRIIKHDSDPSTDLFDIKLTAFSSDPENDEMSYLWEQVRVSIDYEGGPKVELIDYDKPTAYFRAPAGEYRFQLTVTDEYGDSNMDSQVIKIVPEPNEAPLVNFNVSEGAKPIDPFEGDVKKIIEFQKENGLEADGKWGPESEKKHKELLKKTKTKTKIIIKDN